MNEKDYCYKSNYKLYRFEKLFKEMPQNESWNITFFSNTLEFVQKNLIFAHEKIRQTYPFCVWHDTQTEDSRLSFPGDSQSFGVLSWAYRRPVVYQYWKGNCRSIGTRKPSFSNDSIRSRGYTYWETIHTTKWPYNRLLYCNRQHWHSFWTRIGFQFEVNNRQCVHKEYLNRL